jgi:hypothetical protein
MKIISHRGNLNGRNPELENNPDYILSAISAGYEVEIDVWYVDGILKLGHDFPQYPVSISWIKQFPLWCHAKNTEAFQFLLNEKIHCFWHERDKFTLTSCGIPWCYPGNWIYNGITVIFNDSLIDFKIPQFILGICVDNPIAWNQWGDK